MTGTPWLEEERNTLRSAGKWIRNHFKKKSLVSALAATPPPPLCPTTEKCNYFSKFLNMYVCPPFERDWYITRENNSKIYFLKYSREFFCENFVTYSYSESSINLNFWWRKTSYQNENLNPIPFTENEKKSNFANSGFYAYKSYTGKNTKKRAGILWEYYSPLHRWKLF